MNDPISILISIGIALALAWVLMDRFGEPNDEAKKLSKTMNRTHWI